MNVKIAKCCLCLASLCKLTAKFFVPNMIVDSLSLPGWYIVHEHLVKQKPYAGGGIKGMEWHNYELPKEWQDDLARLIRKRKR